MLPANLLVYRLLEVLCVHNGAYFARRIRGPVGRHNLYFRLACIESPCARAAVRIAWHIVSPAAAARSSSGGSTVPVVASSARCRLPLLAQLPEVAVARLARLARCRCIGAGRYKYVRLVYESTLAHLRLTPAPAALHVHLKVAVHAAHQRLVVVYETLDFIAKQEEEDLVNTYSLE